MPAATTELTIKQDKRKLTREEYLIEIDGFVSQVRKAKDRYDRILEMGKQLGYSDKEIALDFRDGMLKAGFSDRTIRRYLPAEMKAKPRGSATPDKIRANLSLNQGQQAKVQEVNPMNFDINYLQQYSNERLIKIIQYLSHENILLRGKLAMKVSDSSNLKNSNPSAISTPIPIAKSKPKPKPRLRPENGYASLREAAKAYLSIKSPPQHKWRIYVKANPQLRLPQKVEYVYNNEGVNSWKKFTEYALKQ
jgi:hypothetical protein